MLEQINPVKVVWLYEKSHLKQPFIQLGIESLLGVGCSVTLINMLNKNLQNVPYDHIGLMAEPRSEKLDRSLRAQYGAYKFGFSMPRIMLKHALRIHPDIIVATLPLGLIVGSLVKLIQGCRLVYYPLELYGEQRSPYSGFLKFMERYIIARSIDSIITQNDRRAEVYRIERSARLEPVIVHNYKPRKTVTASGCLRSSMGLRPNDKIVLYEGKLGEGRLLEQLVESVKYLPNDVFLVLMGKVDPRNGWWRSVILENLKDKLLAHKVRIAPWVQPDNLMNFVADADVGIISYDDQTRNNRFCEPGKLSDYVIAGVPVIAPNYPSIAPVIKAMGVGRTFQSADPKEIASVISEILAIPKDHWRNALKSAQMELVWETQSTKFLSAVLGEKQNKSVN
jgi:glycosyltransferase involved in cell wall biosynthesis